MDRASNQKDNKTGHMTREIRQKKTNKIEPMLFCLLKLFCGKLAYKWFCLLINFVVAIFSCGKLAYKCCCLLVNFVTELPHAPSIAFLP